MKMITKEEEKYDQYSSIERANKQIQAYIKRYPHLPFGVEKVECQRVDKKTNKKIKKYCYSITI